MEKYRLHLIGPFGLFSPCGKRIEISSKKAMALFALLATSPNGERSRRWMQTMLWGSREEAQAQTSLRRELSTLAKTLEGHGAGFLLTRSTQRIGIQIDHLNIDLDTLGLSLPLRKARGAASDFLEGLDLRDCEEFEDWLRDERERVRDMLDLDFPEVAETPPSAEEILGSALPSAADILANAPPRLPPKPSLVVLPFAELTSECGGWLGIGIAEELGVTLSQFPQLFIAGTTSARTLVSQKLTEPEIAKRLGVRYLLGGTVLQLKDRLRASVFLLDGHTGEQLWAETVDGVVAEVFELQSEIARRIAPQIWTRVDTAERSRVLRLKPSMTSDYETYWRANALFRSWEKEAVSEAIELSEHLAAEDPTCPWAASLSAYCHSIAFMMGYVADRDETLRKAIMRYQAAIRYGEDNAEALGYLAGMLINIGGDLTVADRLIAHALTLLPAHQPTLFWGGWVDVMSGRPERAQERFELALRINPATGARGQTLCGIGLSWLLRGDFEQAYQFLLEASQAGPGFFLTHACLCVAAILTGRRDIALDAARILGRERTFDFITLFKDERHRALFRAALAQVGRGDDLADLRPGKPTFTLPDSRFG